MKNVWGENRRKLNAVIHPVGFLYIFESFVLSDKLLNLLILVAVTYFLRLCVCSLQMQFPNKMFIPRSTHYPDSIMDSEKALQKNKVYMSINILGKFQYFQNRLTHGQVHT